MSEESKVYFDLTAPDSVMGGRNKTQLTVTKLGIKTEVKMQQFYYGAATDDWHLHSACGMKLTNAEIDKLIAGLQRIKLGLPPNGKK